MRNEIKISDTVNVMKKVYSKTLLFLEQSILIRNITIITQRLWSIMQKLYASGRGALLNFKELDIRLHIRQEAF